MSKVMDKRSTPALKRKKFSIFVSEVPPNVRKHLVEVLHIADKSLGVKAALLRSEELFLLAFYTLYEAKRTNKLHK